MKKLFLIGILLITLVALIISGCGFKTGIVERLAITAISQEMGIEFAKHNKKLTQEAIIYLEALENFEVDQMQYISMLQIGINYAFDKMDKDRVARLKPLVDQILLEIEINPLEFYNFNWLNFNEIEFPEDFDYDALIAAVKGFRSGLMLK